MNANETMNVESVTREEAERLRADLLEQLCLITYKRISFSRLGVDMTYQRPPVADEKVKMMARTLHGEAFGHVLVGQREDGTCWIVDAQQRLRAVLYVTTQIRQHFPTFDPTIPCAVFQSRGPIHEAAVFYLINAKRTPLKPHETFIAAVKAGFKMEVAISRFLKSRDLSVGVPKKGESNVIGFTNVLVKTWAEDAEACREAMDTQREIVGSHAIMVRAIHKGLWHVLSTDKRSFSASEIASLRKLGKGGICRFIKKVTGKTGERAHTSDCGEAVRILLRSSRAVREAMAFAEEERA